MIEKDHNKPIFDFCIGNPPYQKDNQKEGNRRTTTDIFPLFQEQSSYVSRMTTLIYPATWQKRPNEGLGRFLKDYGLMSSNYYSSNDVFPGITKGYPLSVVTTCKGYNGLVHANTVFVDRDLEVWIDSPVKAELFNKTRKAQQFFYGLSTAIADSNVDRSDIHFVQEQDAKHDVSVYIKKAPGVQSDGGIWYAPREQVLTQCSENILDSYNVSIPSAPVGRMRFFNELLDKRKNLGARVFAPGETHSNTLLVVKLFATEEEAKNCAKYVNSRFFHMICSFDFTKRGFAQYVPDLTEYKNSDPIWQSVEQGKELNEVLCDYFQISDDVVRESILPLSS